MTTTGTMTKAEEAALRDVPRAARHDALVRLRERAAIAATLDQYAAVKARRHARALARSRRNTDARKDRK